MINFLLLNCMWLLMSNGYVVTFNCFKSGLNKHKTPNHRWDSRPQHLKSTNCDSVFVLDMSRNM